MPSRRTRAFAVLAAGCLVGVSLTVLLATRARTADSSGGVTLSDGTVLVRSLASATRGRITAVPAERPEARGQTTGLRCERVHLAGGRGLCLARGSAFAAGYRAQVFDRGLRVLGEIAVPGIPSRTRVSPDGRWGAVTMFVTGHSYADRGAFSTYTAILDLRHGRLVADLEDFSVTRDGRFVDAVDVNFWGVTFARDGDTFFATLATGGRTYLVRGSIRDRTMRTLHDGVECPSLSPDGTRIAFKQYTGEGRLPWRLAVLELASMEVTSLPGTDGVDDQAEWLDGQRLLFARAGAIHVADAAAVGAPQVWRDAADSPAAISAGAG